MNCDLLARPYQALEHLAFADNLEKQRFAFLSEAHGARQALILGEGDGRFLCKLAIHNTDIWIDCVEASANMIRAARRRMARNNVPRPHRIRFFQVDALAELPSGREYDLLVTHFFFDCFNDSEVKRIMAGIRPLCRPSAKLLVADFDEPGAGWRKWHARLWLTAMYSFFRITTGLRTRRLPRYQHRLEEAGFARLDRKLAFADLISSELWQLGPQPADCAV